MLTRLVLFSLLASCGLVIFSGCASTKIVNRQQLAKGYIPRPQTIWVNNFIASASELPSNSTFSNQDLDLSPQAQEHIDEGRKLGRQMASELVEQIRDMGMTAEQPSIRTRMADGDIILRGYLYSINEGSAAKRIIIGFGSGATSLSTMVEGFQVTSGELRKLGSGTIEAEGGKSPGMDLGLATLLITKNPAGLLINGGVQAYQEISGSGTIEGRASATTKQIAEVLKQRFRQEGWIR